MPVEASGKEPVFALVEREGKVRSFHVPEVNGATLREIVEAQLAGKTVVYSDANHTTRFAAKSFVTESVNHQTGEYARGDVHTNTLRGSSASSSAGSFAPITVSLSSI